MTLDPQAKFVLDIAIKNKVPPLDSMSATDAKQAYEARAQKMCLKDLSIGSSEDFEIPGSESSIPVRLYKPIDGGEDLPVVVYYHGGGWVIGSRDSHDALCRQISNEGPFIVLSVDYRMGPEHAFPAAPTDAFDAYKWTIENIQSHGGNATKVAVAGDSAGGNLSAVVSIMARDLGIQPPAFQWLIYPATDAHMITDSHKDLSDGYFLTKDLMDWFQGHYLQNEGDQDDWRVSPLRSESLADLPPALIQTAGFDPLKDEGVLYGERMNKEGSSASHTEYPGMIHGFINLGGVIDQANVAVAEGVEALNAAFGR